MDIQHMINSKYKYRNTKQIQISNAQMTEEYPVACEALPNGKTYRECARSCRSNILFELDYPGSCFDHSNLNPSVLFRISNFVLRI